MGASKNIRTADGLVTEDGIANPRAATTVAEKCCVADLVRRCAVAVERTIAHPIRTRPVTVKCRIADAV